MKRNLFALFTIFILLSGVLLTGCSTNNQEKSQSAGEQAVVKVNEEASLTVYTSMYPLYDFTSKIAGEKAKVINLVPVGSEPHDYEPTAKDLIDLSSADLFVYNGGGFESWIEKIVQSVSSQNPNLLILDSTKDIVLLNANEHGEEAHKEEAHEEHAHEEHAHEEEQHSEEGHEHGEFDPHVWLDPVLAKQQAESIKNALVKLDPNNAQHYENNYKELALQFDELHAKYEELSKNIARKDFVVSHSAFSYLANRYQLNQMSITGLDPSNEPSAQELKKIVEFMKEHQIEYVLFENLITPKVAEVVKAEVGAESLTLHNLEGLTKEEQSQGKDYFSIMEENLENLKIALGYKK